MLTSDLLRFKIDGLAVSPRYLTRKNANYYLNIAQDLIDIYTSHVGETYGELEQALNEYENESVNYKIQRGLAKIMDGFVECVPNADLDYPDYRKKFFAEVEKHRPVVRQTDLVHRNTRDDVLAKITEEIGPPPKSLYGDLPEYRRITGLNRPISPEQLVRHYNLALAQGLLYRCNGIEATVWDNFKTVFRYLKLAQLMHKITKHGDAYRIVIDGPFALFQRTQKYGVNLARFLPGLLLANKWQMTAHINTDHGPKLFQLDQDSGLTSHYRQGNPFDSSLEEAFYHGFRKRKTDWQIQRETEIVDLGDSILIPDFKFVHPDGKEALLEIVGFWTPEYLTKKIEKLRRADRKDLIVAVNEKLNCSREDFDGPVIFIKTRLKVGAVLKLLDEIS